MFQTIYNFFKELKQHFTLRSLRKQTLTKANEVINQINDQGVDGQEIRQNVQVLIEGAETESQIPILNQDQLIERITQLNDIQNQLQQLPIVRQYQEQPFGTISIQVKLTLKAPNEIKNIFQRYISHLRYSYYFNQFYRGNDEDNQQLQLLSLNRSNFGYSKLMEYITHQEISLISRIQHCTIFLKVNDELSIKDLNKVQLFIKAFGLNGLDIVKNNQQLHLQQNEEVAINQGDLIQILPNKIAYEITIFQFDILQQ